MLFAINNKNERILPSKGTNGLCPYCKGVVIAVCGEINIHHWRHDAKSNCDPWKESETEWHRGWKENFPKEWREFIITRYEEKHIADIRTDSGLVVEFQNSSISSTTIKIRESFYEKMIWVINANIFKENFSIRSLVTTKLRENKFRYNDFLSHNLDNDEKVKEIEKEISENDRDLKSNESQISWINRKIKDFEKLLTNLENSIAEILNATYLYGDFGDFKSENISQFKKYKTEISELDKAITPLSEIISRINNFPNSNIVNYEKFKSVPFEEVSAKSYDKCKLVYKETINSFFPKVTSVGSESNFRWYSKQPDKYLLIIDLNEDLNRLNLKLKTIQKKRETTVILKDDVYVNLKSELVNWLNKQIDNENQKKEDLEAQKIELQNLSGELSYEKDYAIKEVADDNLQIENGLKEEQKRKDIEIKKNYKGQYSYNWKHRRKTWDYAECPIFLDFGNHIFSVESDNRLRKINTNEFIETIKNWR